MTATKLATPVRTVALTQEQRGVICFHLRAGARELEARVECEEEGSKWLLELSIIDELLKLMSAKG